jgi:hypothetical protein
MEAHPRVTVALARLKGLFLELPGARLSLADAARLSGLDRDLCSGILSALEDVRFLKRDQDGTYRCCHFEPLEPPIERSASRTQALSVGR